MKRPAPARLRELRLGSDLAPNSKDASQSKSIFSRVPLLQPSSALQNWATGDQVPGFLIPFAFLSSLRANLQISTFEDLHSPSPFSTINSSPSSYENALPISEHRRPFHAPAASQTLTATSPLGLFQSDTEKNAQLEPDDSARCLPPVTTFFTKKEEEIRAALGLIADSAAQQRQAAVQAVLFHPYVVALTVLVFLTSVKVLYTGSPSDLVLMLAVWTTYSLFGVLIVRRLVRGYDEISRQVGDWSWLSASSVSGVSHKRDEVLVAQCEDEIVGVLVLRMAKIVTGAGSPGMRPGGVRSRRKSSARWTGIIRAWTVKESHRMQGVGVRLLEEAAANCRLRSLDGPIFAEDHANAARVLPHMLNGAFEKHERWARAILERTILAQRGR
ncbi:hypothetical protein VTO42DRAFT_8961 [Malbranchea cinnamomea]